MNKEYIKEKILRTGYFDETIDLNKYVDLIFLNQKRLKNQGGGTQKHHWIPRCYFSYAKLPIDNSNDNLVNLLYIDHIKAHIYLASCCNDIALFKKLSMVDKIIRSQSKIPADEKKNIEIFIRKTLVELQRIYDKKLLIQKENDKDFFNIVNDYLSKGMSYSDIDKILNKEQKYTNRRYDTICHRWNWKKCNDKLHSKEDDLRFYKKINHFINEGTSFKEICKKLNLSMAKIGQRYRFVCNKYHLKNNNPINKVDYIKDKKFYDYVNKMLKEGLSFRKISLENKKNPLWCREKYFIICSRNNWKPMNNRSAAWTKPNIKNDKEFYDFVNKYLSDGKTCSDIDLIIKQKKRFTQSKYTRICRRYNWPRYKRSKSFVSEKDRDFYLEVKKLKDEGLTFKEIAKIFHITNRYCETKFFIINKKINPN